MRENRTSGSVWGAPGNRRSYHEMWTNHEIYIMRIYMLELHKNIVLDENQKPIAVQIPIEEFERM